ncbi:MAG: hypothetical protein ABMA64_26870 [Myxococcota bacterium]
MSVVRFAVALVLVGCGSPESEVLSADEMVALRTSVDALDPVRDELPIEDPELELLAIDFVERVVEVAGCERRGVVSGVWYADQSLDGSWFEVGTGDHGGDVAGGYVDGAFDGTATGTGVDAALVGAYADGLFQGEWTTTGAEGEVHTGELVGRYESRNEVGGYFFGVWTECD